MYPIKSCGPILLNKVECTTLGLKDGWLRDRSVNNNLKKLYYVTFLLLFFLITIVICNFRVLMVVDEKNNFITARAYPQLLLVKPLVRNSILTLSYDGMETLHVNLAEVWLISKQSSNL